MNAATLSLITAIVIMFIFIASLFFIKLILDKKTSKEMKLVYDVVRNVIELKERTMGGNYKTRADFFNPEIDTDELVEEAISINY